jgi:hypothetical protein
MKITSDTVFSTITKDRAASWHKVASFLNRSHCLVITVSFKCLKLSFKVMTWQSVYRIFVFICCSERREWFDCAGLSFHQMMIVSPSRMKTVSVIYGGCWPYTLFHKLQSDLNGKNNFSMIEVVYFTENFDVIQCRTIEEFASILYRLYQRRRRNVWWLRSM